MERERERELNRHKSLGETKLYPLDKLTLFISDLFAGFVPAFSVICSVAKSPHKIPMNFGSLSTNGSASVVDRKMGHK